ARAERQHQAGSVVRLREHAEDDAAAVRRLSFGCRRAPAPARLGGQALGRDSLAVWVDVLRDGAAAADVAERARRPRAADRAVGFPQHRDAAAAAAGAAGPLALRRIRL